MAYDRNKVILKQFFFYLSDFGGYFSKNILCTIRLMKIDQGIILIIFLIEAILKHHVLTNVITVDFHNLDLKFIGKIWGVRCKTVQCFTMGELKHTTISSLKSWIVASLPFKYKKVL